MTPARPAARAPRERPLAEFLRVPDDSRYVVGPIRIAEAGEAVIDRLAVRTREAMVSEATTSAQNRPCPLPTYRAIATTSVTTPRANHPCIAVTSTRCSAFVAQRASSPGTSNRLRNTCVVKRSALRLSVGHRLVGGVRAEIPDLANMVEHRPKGRGDEAVVDHLLDRGDQRGSSTGRRRFAVRPRHPCCCFKRASKFDRCGVRQPGVERAASIAIVHGDALGEMSNIELGIRVLGTVRTKPGPAGSSRSASRRRTARQARTLHSRCCAS